MAFLHGYFDESGKYAKDSVVSFCGFVDSGWDEFVYEWQSLLRRRKLPALHLSQDKLKATASQLRMYEEFVHAITKNSNALGPTCGLATFRPM
jgi:hypothetical protein